MTASHPDVGDRVRLTAPMDDPYPVAVGTEGTIDWVSLGGSMPQIGVKWDDGRSLMLLPGIDAFEILDG